jgi:hypothetical protein
MSQGTPRSVNRGHLTSVFSGQHASVLTPGVRSLKESTNGRGPEAWTDRSRIRLFWIW